VSGSIRGAGYRYFYLVNNLAILCAELIRNFVATKRPGLGFPNAIRLGCLNSDYKNSLEKNLNAGGGKNQPSLAEGSFLLRYHLEEV